MKNRGKIKKLRAEWNTKSAVLNKKYKSALDKLLHKFTRKELSDSGFRYSYFFHNQKDIQVWENDNCEIDVFYKNGKISGVRQHGGLEKHIDDLEELIEYCKYMNKK